MLPFLKHDKEGSAASDPKDGDDFTMLDAIAEDLLHALGKKDKSLVKEALAALCEHMQESDRKQDAQDRDAT